MEDDENNFAKLSDIDKLLNTFKVSSKLRKKIHETNDHLTNQESFEPHTFSGPSFLKQYEGGDGSLSYFRNSEGKFVKLNQDESAKGMSPPTGL